MSVKQAMESMGNEAIKLGYTKAILELAQRLEAQPMEIEYLPGTSSVISRKELRIKLNEMAEKNKEDPE